jgi:hypothetical protein
MNKSMAMEYRGQNLPSPWEDDYPAEDIIVEASWYVAFVLLRVNQSHVS